MFGKMKEKFKEYFSQSVIHGLAHIYNNRSPYLVFFSESALIALSFHIALTVLKYFEYRYTETTSLKNDELVSPDVTICSYNAFDANKLILSDFLKISAFFERDKF